MKVELFPFQKVALTKLRQHTLNAIGNYNSTHTPQVVSYTAPTGAGKTIIMASLVEAIYYGDEIYPEQPDAIFVWLSDSPQLNEQSKLKFDTKADKINLNQCVTISDNSFDKELLEDGHIYFLNTQKLSKTSNLTKHSDGRQFTIWETLANTVREKSDRLYLIIDEAHRGAQSEKEMAKATTIMQKFLKGSEDDGLPAFPVVVGVTATAKRFNRLAQGLGTTTVHYVITDADEVRASGLLKDKIIISYPETANNDMAVLQAAADEWKDKWDHWYQYCFEQHYAYVNPVFVIQVQNGTDNRISYTDLDECVRLVEERTGERFSVGEVVHAFGEGTPTLTINGLEVPYVEPSRIADDRRIKVVFFKETLSTGWDCPRAETMMSFRHAKDYTYIAQLLGRMVRTPMQMHINVDESLNDVHLYLPQFDEETVYEVIEALKSTEGADIPIDVEAEEIGNENQDTLTLRPTYSTKLRKGKVLEGQTSLFGDPEPFSPDSQGANDVASKFSNPVTSTPASAPQTSETPQTGPQTATETNNTDETPVPAQQQTTQRETEEVVVTDNINREAVAKAINDAGLLTYDVRKVRITDYLRSMFALARFFAHTTIDPDALDTVLEDISGKIRAYISKEKREGKYKELSSKVLEFKLNSQIFDVFGKSIDNYAIHDLFSTTDTDIDRQLRIAETKLGNEGVGNYYIRKYCEEDEIIDLKIDVILFVANQETMDDLNKYAEEKFHWLNDNYRRRTTTLPEKYKKKYDSIVSNGDIVSKHNFKLPESIRITHESEGKLYANHLFVDDSGTVAIKLNGWEEKVIEEEQNQDDFVCWLRNPSRGSWALRIPYEADGETKPTFPDFLIIRMDGPDYIVDILEPHDPTRVDNLGKAKGFAEYARQNPGVGRIQLIRMKVDSLGNQRPYRLDMSKSAIRDRVSRCSSNEELNHVFDECGFFMI